MPNTLKGLVSKKKIRFQKDGFDLDLTYITPRIIAMGYPAQSWEGIYRNHIDDVVSFFKKRHDGHFQIYNLCNERHIDEQKFGRDTINHEYPFDDHNPPKFTQMLKCCEDIQNYLEKDPENIVAIQCKAGKGRTGVIVCSVLIKQKNNQNATEALQYYGRSRTTNGKGVTIPSQIRYIYYFDHYFHENLKYREINLKLNYLELEELPNMAGNGYEIQVIVYRYQNKKLCQFLTSQFFEVKKDSQRSLKLYSEDDWVISGDIKFQIVLKSKYGKKENLCHCWLNTFFVVHKPPIMFLDEKCTMPKSDIHHSIRKINKICLDVSDVPKETYTYTQKDRLSPINNEKSYKFTLQKQEIDKANKDINNKTFPSNFAMSFFFENSSVPPIPKRNRRKASCNKSSSNELYPQGTVGKWLKEDLDLPDGNNLRTSPATSFKDDNSDNGEVGSESSESSTKQSPSDIDDTDEINNIKR